jgi:hypothetical protein
MRDTSQSLATWRFSANTLSLVFFHDLFWNEGERLYVYRVQLGFPRSAVFGLWPRSCLFLFLLLWLAWEDTQI